MYPFSPQSSQYIHLECWECTQYMVQERIYIEKEQNKTFVCVVLTVLEGKPGKRKYPLVNPVAGYSVNICNLQRLNVS